MTKKIILTLLFTLGLIFSQGKSAMACDIKFSPEPTAVGQVVSVEISQWLEVKTPHYIKVTRNGIDLGFYPFYPQVSTDKWQSSLFMAEGTTVVIATGGTGVPECQQPRTVSKTAGIGGPSTWIPVISPFPEFPKGNLAFMITNVKNFVISLLLFLIITGSLVFLLIGGIMWITGGGNKEALARAKNTVTYAIVGLALGLGSFIILNILGAFFGVNLLNP